MKACAYCGRSNENAADHCKECGTAFYAPDGEPLSVQIRQLLLHLFAACRSPRNMTRAQIKGLLIVLLVFSCGLGLFIKIAAPFDRVALGGHLKRQDAVEIIRIARKDIDSRTPPSGPSWLPAPVQKQLWAPIQRAFSKNPILAVTLQATNTAKVFYLMGPKARSGGPSLMRLVKSEKGWAVLKPEDTMRELDELDRTMHEQTLQLRKALHESTLQLEQALREYDREKQRPN
jgi:hypothetical protein